MKPGKARKHGKPDSIARMKCSWKHPFVSERIAQQRADRGSDDGTPLFVYRCQSCKKWHLTKKRPDDQFTLRKRLTIRVPELPR